MKKNDANETTTVHNISLGYSLWCIYLRHMFTFIAWIILFILCWPLAILALVLYPIFWLISLPFRILGIAVDGVFSLLKGIILLPGFTDWWHGWWPIGL